MSHGVTDELGRRAVHDVLSIHDLNATIILPCLDHEALTFEHNGVQSNAGLRTFMATSFGRSLPNAPGFRSAG